MRSRNISEQSERRIDPTENDLICPECMGDLATVGGETSCLECGLVVSEDWLDFRGKRTFSGGGFAEERTGAPLTEARHDRGLSTEIGLGGDAKGNPLSIGKRRRLNRLRTHHSRAKFGSKAERNLAHGLGEIDRLCSGLDLPHSVRDRACVLYRLAQAENLILGRSIEEMAAGCVFAACRELGWLRKLDEVAGVSSRSESTIRNAYRVIVLELDVKAPPPRTGDYLARLSSQIDAPDRMRTRAGELAEVAEESGIANGRNPAGVAAACLYLAGQEVGPMRTQVTIAELAGVTPVTLRTRVRELRELGG